MSIKLFTAFPLGASGAASFATGLPMMHHIATAPAGIALCAFAVAAIGMALSLAVSSLLSY